MFAKFLFITKKILLTGLMRFKKLFALLTSNKISIYKYCTVAYLACYLLGNLVGDSIFFIFSFFNMKTDLPPEELFEKINVFINVIIVPIIETLLLALMIYLLKFITKNKIILCIISAFIWGIPHGLQSIPWFFSAFTAFFIFATAYTTWREISFHKAFLAACIPHGASNLTAMFVGYLQ